MRVRLFLFGLIALPSFGCGDPHESSPVNLQVLVSTLGVDQDGDYVLRAGDGSIHHVRSSLLLFLPPGEQELVLDGLAPNCAVEGSDSVHVTISLREVARVAFQVACRAVTGAIEVSVPTSGRDFDSDGYAVHVDDVLAARVYPGGAVVVEGLSPGRHVVRLDDFSPNCRVSGTESRTTMVPAGGLTRDTVRITFQALCTSISGDVQILTTTDGVDQDPNGYTVRVDGELEILPCGFYDYYCTPGAPLMLVPNGSYLFVEVPAGEHSYQLGDIAPNCSVLGGDSQTASVVSGEIAVLRFDVTCERS